jgi:hypothetical protein
LQYFLFQEFTAIFQTVKLTKSEFGGCLAVGSTSLLICALTKVAPARWFKKFNMGSIIDENSEAKQLTLVEKLKEKAKGGKKSEDFAPIAESGDDEERENSQDNNYQKL